MESKISKQNATLIKTLFNEGESAEFFKVWNKTIPHEVKAKIEYKILTLYLYVYFVMNHLKTVDGVNDTVKINILTATDSSTQDENDKPLKQSENNESCESNKEDMTENESSNEIKCSESLFSSISVDDNNLMDMFKLFLMRHGIELSSEPEFLPYFALPLIHDPQYHPAYQQVFQEDWLEKLNERINGFLDEMSIEDETVEDLVNANIPSENSSQGDNVHECRYKEKYKQLREKFNKLRNDHKSVVGVASELAIALEDSVKGKGVDLKETLGKCFTMYPDLFSRQQPQNQDLQSSSEFSKSDQVDFSKLDWSKVKDELKGDIVKADYKLCLLQAIRWGVTGIKGDDAVAEISKNDLLGDEILSSLLLPPDKAKSSNSPSFAIQEVASRLTNAVASLPKGRTYLARFIDILTSATLSVSSCKTLDMLVATLCKMSVEKCRSRELVSRGVLEWVLVSLNNVGVSEYFQKYAVSLLLNLCMSVPQDQWAIHPNILVPTLIHLIKTVETKEILENVFACLYCLLKSDPLNNEFMEQDLNSAIRSRMDSNDDHLNKRIELLIEIHTRSMDHNYVTTSYDQLVNNMVNVAMLDAEIDDDDLVHGTPCGSELLHRYIVPQSGDESMTSKGSS